MYEIVAEISIEGCPPFDNAPIDVTAMNDNGVVVGSFIGCNLDHPLPFMWSEVTGFVAIPLPPGVPTAQPMDVNNSNEIVGFMDPTGPQADIAFHWKEGVWTQLPLLPGFPESHAFAINNKSDIVGEAFDPFSFDGFQAVRWTKGTIQTLTFSQEGPESSAAAINDNVSVTGWTGTSFTQDADAFLLSGGRSIVIGELPGTIASIPTAINESDHVAGFSRIKTKSGPTPSRSWVFDGIAPVDLGDFRDNIRTIAADINSVRQVVGHSSTGTNTNRIPFLWQHGELFDLRTLVLNVPGNVILSRAAAINQSGRIAVDDPENSQWLVLAPLDRQLSDVNIDCVVDEYDLIAVLDDWGPNKFGHPADIVASATFQPPGDGLVNAADLAFVLGNWSPQSLREPPVKGNTRRP